MTVSKVAQESLYPGISPSAGSAPAQGKTDDFSKIFATQSAETENESQTQPDTKVQEVKDDKEVVTDKTTQRESLQETEKTEETGDTESVDGVKDACLEETEEEPDFEMMENAVAQLLVAVSDILGVPVEEVQMALQELGISAEELLSGEKIPQLVIALTEGADELSVMTDQEVFSKVEAIGAKAEEILQELADQMNMTPKALKEMIQSMAQEESPVEEVAKTVVKDNVQDTPLMEEVRVQEPIIRPQEAGTEQERDFAADPGEKQQMTFSQTVVKQIEQAVAKVETSYSATATTESVMNQIQDAIRVIQRQDMTEMELQLHPASLGHVKVQLTASEGVITATFTTENETVRAALEAQMITLKQSFEEQGIKVEAVEVTVASHAFEHNLDSGENHTGEQETTEKKRNTRRLSLSELINSAEEEELSEEDRIVTEMMKQNGNTVDYMV